MRWRSSSLTPSSRWERARSTRRKSESTTSVDRPSHANANPPFATLAVPSTLQSTIVCPSLFLNRDCASRISLSVIGEALHLRRRHAAAQKSFDGAHVLDLSGNRTFIRDSREERTDEC